ncbi:hypothetical protein HY441_01270 [Candidatus Microgenomates bacterium]|nr:hypothetical protein [Candidatus Microgenomates bacterium]
MEIGRTIDEHESRLDDVEEVNQRQDSELEETVKTLSGSINDLYDALETAIRRSF